MFCGGKIYFAGNASEEYHAIDNHDIISDGHFFVEVFNGQWYMELVGDNGNWCLEDCFKLQETNIWTKYFIRNSDVFGSHWEVVK